MKRVRLDTGRISYDIVAGPGLLAEAGRLLKEAGFAGGRAVMIADSKACGLHGDVLTGNLAKAGFAIHTIELPSGEEQKSLETAGEMYRLLTEVSAERNTLLLALGGGVIGDLAGFVAATYMRGMPLIQFPTTLLSQGDSSIGGKTAVNHGQIKNKIGVFYHPRLTISDISVLKTLTPREVSNGLSEIIKHGVILDAEFFDYLEQNMESIRQLDEEVLETIVSRSAAIKAGVVEKDELDTRLRNILNCGHTIGHAIESVSGLKTWHGEAVAIGLLAEANISREMGYLSPDDVRRIESVLAAAGLPCQLPKLETEKILEAMHHDKKMVNGRIRFALPAKIGEAVLTDDVSISIIKKALVI